MKFLYSALVLLCWCITPPVHSSTITVITPIFGPVDNGEAVVRYNTTQPAFDVDEDTYIVNARFDKLDGSALDSLTGIDISLNYSINANLGVGIIDASFPARFSSTVDVTQNVVVGLGSSVFTSLAEPVQTYQLELGCAASSCGLSESIVINGLLNLSFDQSSPFLSDFLQGSHPSTDWILSLRLNMMLNPDVIPGMDYAMSMKIDDFNSVDYKIDYKIGAVPIPAAVWLFGTALIGLVGFSKRRKAA